MTRLEIGAAIAMGVGALLSAGGLPLLLAALADERRISLSGIGLAAMLEALTMAAVAGMASAGLPPQRLRLIGALSAVLVAGLNLAMLHTRGAGALALRGLVGAPEGLLLWICIGMIARTATPARWAGVFLTALTLCQFLLASICAAWIVPRAHADGGFALLAGLSCLFAPIALLAPRRLAPLPQSDTRGGLPPPRGWVALTACLVLAAASGAVGLYIVPLAEQAHLGLGAGGAANAVSLAAQVIGGLAAVAAAGKVRYFHVCLGGGIASMAAWSVFAAPPSVWLFWVAAATFGFVLLFVTPFFVPMTIDADPTRRTAVQSGAAQVLGGAVGPLLAALAVGDRNARGVLVLAAALTVVGLGLIAYLHATHKPAAAT